MQTKPTNYNAPKDTSTDFKSEMETIDREIERRQMEIQSMAQKNALVLDPEEATRIFEKITVPHNLSEMLSKISQSQTGESSAMEVDENDDDDEYVPGPIVGNFTNSARYSAMTHSAPIVSSMMDIDERIAMFQAPPASISHNSEQPSRLANMTDADLMKLVPDGALAPPPPKISEADFENFS